MYVISSGLPETISFITSVALAVTIHEGVGLHSTFFRLLLRSLDSLCHNEELLNPTSFTILLVTWSASPAFFFASSNQLDHMEISFDSYSTVVNWCVRTKCNEVNDTCESKQEHDSLVVLSLLLPGEEWRPFKECITLFAHRGGFRIDKAASFTTDFRSSIVQKIHIFRMPFHELRVVWYLLQKTHLLHIVHTFSIHYCMQSSVHFFCRIKYSKRNSLFSFLLPFLPDIHNCGSKKEDDKVRSQIDEERNVSVNIFHISWH